MKSSLLTKSDYMLFLRHPAWLWLKKHDKSKLPPVDTATQALFDTGHDFEKYAESLFPDGVTLGFSDCGEYRSLPLRTSMAIESGAKTIFQGRFEANGLTFIGDVIQVVGENEVDLYEIKSSTRVKDEHLYDLAFQMVVLEKCGYRLNNIGVAHVNNEYVREGQINPRGLVTIVDVTNQVQLLREYTLEKITEAIEVISTPSHPDFSPSRCGLGCLSDWLVVYRNLYNLEEGSIYDLCRLTPELVGELESRGIKRIFDIPVDIPLNKFQSRQVEVVKSGQVHSEPEVISAILNRYQYPLYFLDYETLSSAVPDFDGLHPYEQIPFQYSLHAIDSPGGALCHLDYLHLDSSNPAHLLINRLKQDIGDTGSIVAWNSTFEKGCNTRLARLCPEYAEFLINLNSRIVDLADPFSAGLYVDKDFLGKYSIKNVLPVLVPELSYAELAIHEGGTAQRVWMDAFLYGKQIGDIEAIKSNLLRYCELDTLAMVRIYEYLLKI